MTVIRGVDPAKDLAACAWANVNANGTLLACGWGLTFDEQVDYIAGEKPQIYDGTHGNDLIDETLSLGEFRAQARRYGLLWAEFWPAAWKGQLKKWIHHRALWETLTGEEALIIARAVGYTPVSIYDYIVKACETAALGKKPTYTRKQHNILDAVGIAKWAAKQPETLWQKLT